VQQLRDAQQQQKAFLDSGAGQRAPRSACPKAVPSGSSLLRSWARGASSGAQPKAPQETRRGARLPPRGGPRWRQQCGGSKGWPPAGAGQTSSRLIRTCSRLIPLPPPWYHRTSPSPPAAAHLAAAPAGGRAARRTVRWRCCRRRLCRLHTAMGCWHQPRAASCGVQAGGQARSLAVWLAGRHCCLARLCTHERTGSRDTKCKNAGKTFGVTFQKKGGPPQ
jgi:hypothetical protein